MQEGNVIRALKVIQLLISMGVFSFMLAYPGMMVLFTSVVGLSYVAAAIGSMRDSVVAIWLAFFLSTLAAVYFSLVVSQVFAHGFNFLTGSWPQHDGLEFVPYLYLALSLGSVTVVILHLASWKWMIGRKQ
jgi:hypothetical protein